MLWRFGFVGHSVTRAGRYHESVAEVYVPDLSEVQVRISISGAPFHAGNAGSADAHGHVNGHTTAAQEAAHAASKHAEEARKQEFLASKAKTAGEAHEHAAQAAHHASEAAKHSAEGHGHAVGGGPVAAAHADAAHASAQEAGAAHESAKVHHAAKAHAEHHESQAAEHAARAAHHAHEAEHAATHAEAQHHAAKAREHAEKAVEHATAHAGAAQHAAAATSSAVKAHEHAASKASKPAEKSARPVTVKKEAAEEFGAKHYGEWVKSLNPKERESITHYTSADFQQINGQLRQNNGDLGRVKGDLHYYDGKIKDSIQHLDAAMAKTPGAPVDMVVHRKFKSGVGIDPTTWKAGGTFKEHGFMSTEVSGHVSATASNVQVFITAPKGTKGMFLAKSTIGYSGGHEFLLPRGTTLRIDKIRSSRGQHTVHATVVQE